MNFEAKPGMPIPENEKPKEWSMNDALGEILRLEHQIESSEPVDVERNQFALLRSDLMHEKLSPNEAVKKAMEIVASMQSYH